MILTTLALAVVPAILEPRDYDRDGTVDAYYASNRDLTYAADANLLGPTGFPSGQSFDLFGLSNWRLPRVTEFRYDFDEGGNLIQAMPLTSELSGLNLAAFVDLQDVYWHETLVPTGGWNENFPTYYVVSGDYSWFVKEPNSQLFVWAVRDGDVEQQAFRSSIPAIPEPGTWAFLLAGLGVIALLSRSAQSG